ncbi:MAG: zinc-dependent metalloprotease [Phycisphaerae bacterium]|nr:zinc-dependent metalloprotease [Phycisphaerae bacterium]
MARLASARILTGAVLFVVSGTAMSVLGQPGGAPPAAPGAPAEAPKPDFRPWAEVSKDFRQVVSTADGQPSFYGVWVRDKDSQMLAELPRNWASQKQFIAMTLPTGELFAGLQAGDMYVYWKRVDKRLLLVAPNTDVRSTGDKESKDSIQNHFVDRVLVDVPIECMGPNGNPVIDMRGLLVGNIGVFYGGMAGGARGNLATIAAAKAFPKNVELSWQIPAAGGLLKTFHWSISLIEDTPGYQPRAADERVGYFTTEFRDLGKFVDDQVPVRYINRWHLEKADPKLKLSPPKTPIVYYVEHTVPVRYRRWVREGIVYWNKAFEQVGIKDAIEVYYQESATGAHMDKDPEDVRYNFVRWLSNDIGTAIGPSRAHPLTGQILDADIVLTDGWIRHFWYQSQDVLPMAAMEGMNAEALAWLDEHPSWDPRVLLAAPEDREAVLARRMAQRAERLMTQASGDGHEHATVGDVNVDMNPELARLSQLLGGKGNLCTASEGMARNMAMMGLFMHVNDMLDLSDPAGQDGGAKPGGEGKKDEKKDEGDKIDGIPEWFVGPALAHLTVHEVGHTLGLRHNFKSSSIYTMAQINSAEMKGKPFTGSVMDYTPVNINMNEKLVQGDFNQIGIGPYDMWAIEYGYTTGDVKEVLKKVSDPLLTYATDEDTGGPDPLARRYDLAADPLAYAQDLVKLAATGRTKIIEKFVKDGEPWSRARRGYEITLSTQMNGVNIIANWLGGSNIVRDRKGDPGNRAPVTPLPAETQRAALKFVIDNSFFDAAFGLTPELLGRMTVNKDATPGSDATWPVHDRVSGVQASALTMLMNPVRLRRVYDNEFMTPADKDAFTLPEMIDTISAAIWSELDKDSAQKYTARQPMISSLRRALQREHAERLIDLSIGGGSGPAGRTIATLATAKLRELQGRIEASAKRGDANLDPYSRAHLGEIKTRIARALDAHFTYNGGGGGAANFPWFMFMRDAKGQPMGTRGEESRSQSSGER